MSSGSQMRERLTSIPLFNVVLRLAGRKWRKLGYVSRHSVHTQKTTYFTNELLDHQATELEGPQVTELLSPKGADKDKPETVPDAVPRETLLPVDETQMTPPMSHSRPCRVTKPSKKYSPETYDLSQ